MARNSEAINGRKGKFIFKNLDMKGNKVPRVSHKAY